MKLIQTLLIINILFIVLCEIQITFSMLFYNLLAIGTVNGFMDISNINTYAKS